MIRAILASMALVALAGCETDAAIDARTAAPKAAAMQAAGVRQNCLLAKAYFLDDGRSPAGDVVEGLTVECAAENAAAVDAWNSYCTALARVDTVYAWCTDQREKMFRADGIADVLRIREWKASHRPDQMPSGVARLAGRSP